MLLATAGTAQGLEGSWEATVQILPSISIYSSILTLKYSFATDWSIESESKVYSGAFKYQNFYLDGKFGDWDVWGKIYFSVQDVRYQKLWANFEMPLPGEDDYLRLSVNHWSGEDDYSSYDKETFGPWPCTNVVSWDEAWRHVGRTLHVEGPVAGYYRFNDGSVAIYIGNDYPDPDRFQIYIPSDHVDDFEAAFGTKFWEHLIGRTICAYGEIEDFRYDDYSVAEIALEDPEDLSLMSCCGFRTQVSCPGTVIRWFEAKDHYHETLYVQGPVVSVYVSGGGSVTIHIGEDYPDPDRFDIYIPSSYVGDFKAVFGSDFPDNLVGETVCIYGYIKTYQGIYEIETHDPADLSIGPCCSASLLSGPLMIYRAKVVYEPLTLTLDFADCCTGIWFKKLELELEGMSLCCGVLYDLDLAFTKCHGFEYLKLTLDDLFDLCCDISVGAEVEFGVDYKKVSIVPSWQNIEGCVSIWGDVDLSGNSFTGLELYGFGFTCAFGDVEVTEVTALNPEKIEDLTDYSFYEDEGEFEYLSLEYGFSGCCGGDGSFQTQFWFGNKTMLFGLQRVRFDLEVPVSENISFIAKTQLKLWETSPIQWFDIGWTIEF